MPILELNNISKHFGAIQAVNDVSLSLEPGEVVGLMGDNGAGKSTLVKMIAGNFLPSTGTMKMEGQEIVLHRPVEARRHGIEIVHQDLALCNNLTAAANVFLGREISETRDYSEKIAEEIDEEVRRLIEEAQARARNIMREHRALLDKLVGVLMEVETLEGDALTRLLNSDPNEPWPPADMPKKEDTPPAGKVADDMPRRPSFEPKPAPGLAWEGGSQITRDP